MEELYYAVDSKNVDICPALILSAARHVESTVQASHSCDPAAMIWVRAGHNFFHTCSLADNFTTDVLLLVRTLASRPRKQHIEQIG